MKSHDKTNESTKKLYDLFKRCYYYNRSNINAIDFNVLFDFSSVPAKSLFSLLCPV